MIHEEQIKTIIQRCQRNDYSAFALLVEQYRDMIFRLVFRMICDEEEAKDITQDVFVKIWLSLDSYNGDYRFSTWIYRIACNACYDFLRSQRHIQASSFVDLSDSDVKLSSGEDIEQVLDNKALVELILRYTEELTPKQKMVFMLRDVEELEVKEVQEITGLSAEKIKSNLYQARKQIRLKMEKDGEVVV